MEPTHARQLARSFQPHEVRGFLAKLRDERGSPEKSHELAELTEHISQAMERILLEQAGMAEELLCVYEQLGIVFEVTRRLATVLMEREVIRLFLDSLRQTFRGCEVFTARPNGAGEFELDGTALPNGHWVCDGIARARKRCGVLVDQRPAELASASIEEVMFGPMSAGEVFVGAIVLARGPSAREFRASDMSVLQSLSAFCGDLIRNLRLVRVLRETSIAMVRSLVNAVEQKDVYTCGHSLRVGYYATQLGRELKLDKDELQMLQWSALLHDVGKIGIRDEVLCKQGKLTDDEFRHIKEHPVRSYRVVQEVPQLAKALDGVLHHHEHYDGSGYPSGLVGEAIPLQARIIQIADVFDALTSSRPYRPAHPWTKALAIMESEAGTTLDPVLQKTFDTWIRGQVDERPESWSELFDRAQRFECIHEEFASEAQE